MADRRRVSTRTERVLIACRACLRQYDVSGISTGSRVRCECGAALVVEAPRPRQPRPLKCGRCGGPLREAAGKCDYCEAEFTLEERGLSGVCPLCYARLLAEARFCMECGGEIAPQALRAVAEGVVCPRCKGGLRSRAVGTAAVVECSSCGGLWLSAADLERICEKADVEGLVRQHMSQERPTVPELSTRGPAYLPCPTCGDLMVRRNFGTRSGVLIDMCRGHGVWLDHRELERVLDFVRGGGLARAREIELERQKIEAERARDLQMSSIPEGPAAPGARLQNLADALSWLARGVESWVRS